MLWSKDKCHGAAGNWIRFFNYPAWNLVTLLIKISLFWCEVSALNLKEKWKVVNKNGIKLFWGASSPLCCQLTREIKWCVSESSNTTLFLAVCIATLGHWALRVANRKMRFSLWMKKTEGPHYIVAISPFGSRVPEMKALVGMYEHTTCTNR